VQTTPQILASVSRHSNGSSQQSPDGPQAGALIGHWLPLSATAASILLPEPLSAKPLPLSAAFSPPVPLSFIVELSELLSADSDVTYPEVPQPMRSGRMKRVVRVFMIVLVGGRLGRILSQVFAQPPTHASFACESVAFTASRSKILGTSLVRPV